MKLMFRLGACEGYIRDSDHLPTFVKLPFTTDKEEGTLYITYVLHKVIGQKVAIYRPKAMSKEQFNKEMFTR